jgi:hypothetical protein
MKSIIAIVPGTLRSLSKIVLFLRLNVALTLHLGVYKQFIADVP